MRTHVLAIPLLGLPLALLSCAPKVVDVSEKGGACDYGADPSDDASLHCADGYSCEPIAGSDGAYVCAEPVIIRGHVFDALLGVALEGALITALDRTSAPVSDVAASDADGFYELHVTAFRDEDGEIADDAIYTLQGFAADYAPFPFGVRPALPVSAADGVVETVPGDDLDGDGDPDDYNQLVIETPTTDVALIPLPAGERGGGTIHGSVLGELPAGTLVVAEGGATPAPYGLADRSGEFTIFNVQPGTVSVVGYRAGLEIAPVTVDVAPAMVHEVDLNVVASGDALGSVSGDANIVNAPGGSVTSVVLVPTSVYNEPLERGPVPFGLRTPDPGIAPNVSGAFTIDQVPAGTYKVLAAFENDFLVRDPDTSIAGTQIQEVTVDSGGVIQVPENFKITEALEVFSPGAEEPEAVSGAPEFVFADDSSEDGYIVVVYDALGELVWEKDDVPGVSGSATVTVPYEGPALIPGMWYQFWATSFRDKQGNVTRISRTEDLRGVFYAQ
ncbi:MAG: carboxypeptidase regulatory-like domain-containing protein [Myxococcales bacterium]|nr:carboxypeptidase regulatory-like domain-containing protein [Myxococcales bacterium]